MDEIQQNEEHCINDVRSAPVDVVQNAENEGSCGGCHVYGVQSSSCPIVPAVDIGRRSLNQFGVSVLHDQDIEQIPVFEKHNDTYDVNVFIYRGCLCAKIIVNDNFVIQDLLDEIDHNIGNLTIEGRGSQYTPYMSFDTITLNFSVFKRLTTLVCNKIYNLNQLLGLPASLLKLDCSFTGIYDLDCLPPDLKVLICSFTNITRLDNLPHNLEMLICSNNHIKSLDFLPHQLQILDCSCNELRELCHLPSSLCNLYCSWNNVILIDNIPQNLHIMNVSGNPIIHLRNLPESLSFLNCKDCDRLAAIGNIPAGIQTLVCNGTNLTWLDLSKCKSLQRFVCNDELLLNAVLNDESSFSYHYYSKSAIVVVSYNHYKKLMKLHAKSKV